ncbi:DUF3515 domain-containing protein [Corynebacterium pacaense]|uniref:DUF3515 domain-containing protein n=1 Tax=Corynebacterium pacaense TaxID=1816684 RepID=UPI001FEA2E75|nr:DUF3515 domain-containing protein [Corynebacterium pacaense]
MSAEKQNPGAINKTPMVIALILSLILVAAVLIGARVLLGPAGQQRISMGALPAPDAESEGCSKLMEDLPDKAFGHTRASLVDPVPAGVAAWAGSDLEQVTLRCGVSMPFQYTALSDTVEVGGTTWLPVGDVTAGSSLKTWYSVDRFPVVAITADSVGTGGADNPVEPFSPAVSILESRDPQPYPAPLVDLRAAGAPPSCTALEDRLPESFEVGGEDSVTYTRIEVDRMRAAGYGSDALGWHADGMEPVVLRCGVEASPNYAAGAVLQQVNGIPWFEDTVLASGTTSSTWYALGRETDIAISLPQAAGQILVPVTGAIEATVPQR